MCKHEKFHSLVQILKLRHMIDACGGLNYLIQSKSIIWYLLKLSDNRKFIMLFLVYLLGISNVHLV